MLRIFTCPCWLSKYLLLNNVFGESLPAFYWIVYGFFWFCFLFVAVELFGCFFFFLYFLDVNPLLDKWFGRYFLCLPRLPFHFVDGLLFVHRSFLVRCGLTSLFLLLLPLLLESHWKIQHQKWYQSAYCLMFSTGSFVVSGPTFKSDPSWVNFWVKIVIQFSFFCRWWSSFPTTIYWKDCSFSIIYSWLFVLK